MDYTGALKGLHCIDALWCDHLGVYVRGWAHAHETFVQAISLKSGLYGKVADLIDRPDVADAFPALASPHCGFAVYLECEPFRPVTLTIETDRGSIDFDVIAPPRIEPGGLVTDAPAPLDDFIARMKASRGTVVEIGARVVGQASSLLHSRFAPECRYLGVDIHAAPGVDLVGDAHALSLLVQPGSISGILSLAVLEHIAAPWVVAAEINRALKLGGLTFHLVPQTYPIHEMPNDFWRMTDEGLKVLFGQATGFEVVSSGMSDPVQIYMPHVWRKEPFLEMPLHPGMSSSYIIARKIGDLAADAVSWPNASGALRIRSDAYPAHNLRDSP